MAGRAYAQLLRTPGVSRLAVSYLALGIAVTMAPVSFVLFAHCATGSFASASLVLAGSTAGGVLAAPLRGRLVDRVGPSAAVLRLVLPSVATDVAFILAACWRRRPSSPGRCSRAGSSPCGRRRPPSRPPPDSA